MTSHAQASLTNRLIEVGAQGYCLKGIAAETLVLAIRSVAAGASWWDLVATQEIYSAFNAQEIATRTFEKSPHNPLTQREHEILVLLAAGKTNPEIAEALYIAPGTVRVHVHAILHKLEVGDRHQAIEVAIQRQILSR